VAAADDLHTALTRLARSHRAAVARALAPLGLHPGQERLLAVLWEHDGATQAEIAAALSVEPPTVTRMIGRLEVAGFVVRHRHPDDRRATQVWLTDAGWDVRRDVLRATARVSRRIESAMTDRQAAALKTALGLAADALDD
jgi:DNA-binding MarR family transcriptional regulator